MLAYAQNFLEILSDTLFHQNHGGPAYDMLVLVAIVLLYVTCQI